MIHNVNITFKKAQFDASSSIQHNEFPGFHLFNIEIFGYSDVNPWKPILDKNALPVAAPSCRWSWYLPRKILHSNKKKEQTRQTLFYPQKHAGNQGNARKWSHESVWESYLSAQWNRVERLVDLIDVPVLSGEQHFSLTQEAVRQKKQTDKSVLQNLSRVPSCDIADATRRR